MADSRGRWSDLGEAEQRAVLERLDRLAYWLDDRFRVPGTNFRVGLDGVVGLIPGVGDLATNAITAYMVYEAWRLGAPASILGRMLANLGIDTIVGLVPILGDVLDIGFKANRRNARLLRRHFGARVAAERGSSPAVRRI
ncbi:MAG: DUF4112 domain-containing protein [Geminicoccaceae bacterium]